MKLEIIKLIAKIHYGDRESQNRLILDENIKHMNLSENEKIFIDVFTKKLDKIVTDYEFAKDLVKITDESLLALAFMINPGTIEYSKIPGRKRNKIAGDAVGILTEHAGERYGRIQNWMTVEDIKREIFGNDLKSTRLFLNGDINTNDNWVANSRIKAYNGFIKGHYADLDNYFNSIDIEDLLLYFLYASKNKKFNFLIPRMKELMLSSSKMKSKYLSLIPVYKTDKIRLNNSSIIAEIVKNHWKKYYLGDGEFAENNEYGAVDLIERAVRHDYGHEDGRYMLTFGLLPDEIIEFYREYMQDDLIEIFVNNNTNHATMCYIANKILNQEERDRIIELDNNSYTSCRFFKTNNMEFLKEVDEYDTRRYYIMDRYLIGEQEYLKEHLSYDAVINTNILNNSYRYNDYFSNLQLHLDAKNAVDLLKYHSLFLQRNYPGIYKIIMDSLKIHSKEDLDVFIQQHNLSDVMWHLMKTEYLSHKTITMMVRQYIREIKEAIQSGYSWYYVRNYKMLALDRVFKEHNINLIDYLPTIKEEIQETENKEMLKTGWKLFGNLNLPDSFFE